MNALFFTFLTLFLIIFQSAVLPLISWFPECFDLMVINVIFLSLFYSHYAAMAAIIGIGWIMDSISGGPLFCHVFSYLWIYIIVRLFERFVFRKSLAFVLIISIVSVFIQQGLILFSIIIIQGKAFCWETDLFLLIRQALWAMVVIPLSLSFLDYLRRKWLYGGAKAKKQFVQRYRD